MIVYAWYMEDEKDKVLAKGDGEITLATSALEVIREEVAKAFDELSASGKIIRMWSTISITLARKG